MRKKLIGNSRNVHVNHEGLKVNRTQQLLVFADDVNFWGRNMHIIKRYGRIISHQ
jgi:hypothetical protein